MRIRVTAAEEPTAAVRFCLMFPRETISVPVMRRVLGDTLSGLGVDDDCVADLLLAVTEACTNVLQHSAAAHRYEVVVSVGQNRCVLDVLDGSRGFRPVGLYAHLPSARLAARSRLRRRRDAPRAPAAQVAPAGRAAPSRQAGLPSAVRDRPPRPGSAASESAIARLPESGRGLAIMRACVDDVTLRSRPGRGTVVSLRKRIELRRDAPLAHPETARLRDAG